MNRGAPSLVITVIPGSATDELEGLSGAMSIRIENGKHFYDLAYKLGPA